MRPTPSTSLLVRASACALFVLAACHAGASKETTIAARPTVPAPADLMLEVSLPKLDGGLAGLGAYADKVQPGVGGLVNAQAKQAIASIAGAVSLAGAKEGEPVVLLAVGPKTSPAHVVLVSVGDEKKLRESATGTGIRVQDGHALIGPQAAVDALAPYAFGWLAHQPAPASPIAILHVPALMAAYRPEIEAGIQQVKGAFDEKPEAKGAAEIIDAELSGALALLDQSDAAELRLEASAELASVDLALVPRAGTPLATFVAAQKPVGDALLGRLPVLAPSFVAVGQMYAGPQRDAILGVLAPMLARVLGLPDDAELKASFGQLFDATTGSFAMVGEVKKGELHLAQLTGATDGAKAAKIARQMFAKLLAPGSHVTQSFGIKTTYTGTPDAGTHDGVALSGYRAEADRSSMVPAVAAAMPFAHGMSVTFGGWDDVVGAASVSGTDGPALMGSIIDASRGKAPRLQLPAGQAGLLADSRKREESFTMVFDVSGLIAAFKGGAAAAPAKSGVVIALGFQGGRAHLRMALPADHLLEILAATGTR
jgi:hypothetical protein